MYVAVTELFPEWTDILGLHDQFFRVWAGVPYGCHVACFEFATAKFVATAQDHADSLRLFRATERVFKPSAAYNRRRCTWMRDKLASCLQLRFPAIPLELWLMVAGYLVPEYAIACLASAVPRRGGDGRDRRRSLLDRNRDIWARYVHLDGVRYVASLSNSPQHGHTTRLHTAAQTERDGGIAHQDGPVVGLHMVEGHLGIMDVQFYRGKPAFGAEWPVHYVDLQWRSLQFGNNTLFSAISDVCFSLFLFSLFLFFFSFGLQIPSRPLPPISLFIAESRLLSYSRWHPAIAVAGREVARHHQRPGGSSRRRRRRKAPGRLDHHAGGGRRLQPVYVHVLRRRPR